MASATNGYRRLRGLTIEQRNAIELLVMGETDASVAEYVGVHRVTIARWRAHDVQFIAEVNRRRREVWGAATDRLRSLLPKALDALEAELQEPGRQRGRVALEVCRLAGLESSAFRGDCLGVEGIGPTDAGEIIDRIALGRRVDPFDSLSGGAVTELERASVMDDLNSKLEERSDDE